MVNTFITYWDVDEIAKSLDYKRLGKQRVEAYQLWRANKEITKGWRNHPAARMWKGYECALATYTNAMIREWIKRGYKNNMEFLPCVKNPRFPLWWGHEPVKISHRASLNRKNPDFYHFDVPEFTEYVWPKPALCFTDLFQKSFVLSTSSKSKREPIYDQTSHT